MSVAKSLYAFPDCREFLNQAMQAEHGMSALFKERGKATSFRLRCYTARRRALAMNKKVYSPDDVMFEQTAWDGLVLFMRECEEGWEVVAIQDGSAALGAQVISIQPVGADGQRLEPKTEGEITS